MSGTTGTFDDALVDADAAFRRLAIKSIAEHEAALAALREMLPPA